MNVFVDIGAYNGDSIEEFRNWSKIAFAGKRDWIIHAFEPNPTMYALLKEKENGSTFTYRKAAWIEETTLEFAVDTTETPLGSTLMESKKSIWDNYNHIEVDGFDFSEWLKQFRSDYVVVKMDAEGAEFPILEKMIEDRTIHIPAVIMVEFHPNKVIDYTTTYTNELIERIRSMDVNLKDWH